MDGGFDGGIRTPGQAVLRARAEAVAQALAEAEERFEALPDERDARVHVLFAQLYRITTERWLAALAEMPDPAFAYRVIVRFHEIYEAAVPAVRGAPIGTVPRPWRKYHRLARRLSLRGPMTLHLILVSLAARAHVRHDLGPAIAAAEADHRADTGQALPARQVQAMLHGALSDRAFLSAAHEFVALYRGHPSWWRRLWLRLSDRGLTLLQPIWLSTFQGWRRASHRDAHAGSG